MTWHAYVLIALSLSLVAWLLWGRCVLLARFLLAPWKNDRHKYLSLARMCATALVALTCYAGACQAQYFWPHGGAALVGFEMFVLWLDVATSKLSQEAMLLIAGKVKVPGLERLAALLPTQAELTGVTLTGGEGEPEPQA